MPTSPGSRLTFATVLDAGVNAGPLAYEQPFATNQLQKRIIEQVRTRYRPNDLGGAENNELALLPLGVIESLALSGEAYKLALTPGLVDLVYGDKVTDAMFETEGRYVHSEGDANWWISSGRSFFSPVAGDAPAQELAFAREHFSCRIVFVIPSTQLNSTQRVSSPTMTTIY